jgi:L-threonine-O-3-phosphate decarboxylase
MIDFSANINPFGPSPLVRAAVTTAAFDEYPDPGCSELREALAHSLNVSPECILPGNGASDLIWLTALAFIRPGSRALVIGPTFCEYARAAQMMGGQVTDWHASEGANFIPSSCEIAELLKSVKPHAVFLCNPNNPTGTILLAETISACARRHPRTLFVVDEAYLPFASSEGSFLPEPEQNILLLRSMTKDFGLAGLRLGYAVASESVIALLRKVQPPWSVNALAQVAGIAALSDPAHRAHALDQLAMAKQKLVTGLARLGLNPVASATHFILLKVGNGAAFRSALLTRGFLVRDCESFGLPAHVRIATRKQEDNDRLLAAIREVAHAG